MKIEDQESVRWQPTENRPLVQTMMTLATAHPAKFPDAVKQAGYPNDVPLPHHMADLFEREERYERLPGDYDAVKAFVLAEAARG